MNDPLQQWIDQRGYVLGFGEEEKPFSKDQYRMIKIIGLENLKERVSIQEFDQYQYLTGKKNSNQWMTQEEFDERLELYLKIYGFKKGEKQDPTKAD